MPPLLADLLVQLGGVVLEEGALLGSVSRHGSPPLDGRSAATSMIPHAVARGQARRPRSLATAGVGVSAGPMVRDDRAASADHRAAAARRPVEAPRPGGRRRRPRRAARPRRPGCRARTRPVAASRSAPTARSAPRSPGGTRPGPRRGRRALHATWPRSDERVHADQRQLVAAVEHGPGAARAACSGRPRGRAPGAHAGSRCGPGRPGWPRSSRARRRPDRELLLASSASRGGSDCAA